MQQIVITLYNSDVCLKMSAFWDIAPDVSEVATASIIRVIHHL
jgi:hypothetical protein